MSNLLKTTQQEKPPTAPWGHPTVTSSHVGLQHQHRPPCSYTAWVLGQHHLHHLFFFFFFHHPEYFESSRAPQVGSGCTSQGQSCISARMNERAAGCTLPGTEIGDLAPF